CDERGAFVARATGLHLVGLSSPPVGLEAEEDGVAENLAQRGEHRLPCAKRELHDRVEVVLLEVPDLDAFPHGCRWTLPSTRPFLRGVAGITLPVRRGDETSLVQLHQVQG